MNFKMPQANKSRSSMNLNNVHILTHNFGNVDVIRTQYMVPGDKMSFDVSSFTRLMPLPCPTYSDLRMILRGFFVPLNYLVRDFDKFLQDSVSNTLQGQKVVSIPYTTPMDILSALVEADLCTIEPGVQKYDFHGIFMDNGQPQLAGFVLTPLGRRVRSFLLQLGYKLPHCFVLSDSSIHTSYDSILAAQQEKMSLLPLLAFVKFYTDWVVPARFVDSNYGGILAQIGCDYDSTNCYFSCTCAATNHNPAGGNNVLLEFVSLMPFPSFLHDDYFTSAFKSAYGNENASASASLSGLEVVSSGTSSSMVKDVLSKNSARDGQPFTVTSSTNNVLTQIQLLALGRLQKLVDNRKVTDSHVLDWLRVTYGVTPGSKALHLSEYKGAHQNVIQIGDIMATATTDSTMGTTVVGQYAGKGIGGMQCKWSHETDTHGLFFITCELQTQTSYVQGVDPFMKCLKPTDFFNELFDNVGVRAIARRELVFDTFDLDVQNLQPSSVAGLPAPDSVFGYAPRFSEFKQVQNMISGDFVNPSVNTGLDSWYLSRKFSLQDVLAINLDFCSASNRSVGSQYDRIFQNTSDVDHFYSGFRVVCRASRPMQSISEYFEEIEDYNSKTQDVENNNVIG